MREINRKKVQVQKKTRFFLQISTFLFLSGIAANFREHI